MDIATILLHHHRPNSSVPNAYKNHGGRPIPLLLGRLSTREGENASRAQKKRYYLPW